MKKNGPYKTPTKLKLLRGTYRADRAPKAEPVPTSAPPDCPAQLSGEAKVEWERLSAELAALGLLTGVDRAALAAYCDNWAAWIGAVAKCKKDGNVIAARDGRLVINPYFSIKKRSADLMHKFLTEFGMTPASRTRISAKPVEADKPTGWKNFGAK